MKERQRTVLVRRKTILWLSFLVLATCLIGLSEYLFGGRLFVFYDIGSNTWEQYISLYGAIAQKIASGEFGFWLGTVGFGTCLFMLNPTNPVLAVVYCLGAAFGTEIIPQVMVFCYIAEIFAAGLLAYFYLSTFSFREIPKLLAAYMYAFSGFMIVWGQHYQYAIVPALLMLELLMVERCLRHRRWAGLVPATALAAASGLNIAYMILLFTCIYVLLRLLLTSRGIKQYIKEAFRIIWPMVLGVCLSMVTLLPSAYSLFCVSGLTAEDLPLITRMFYQPALGYVQAVIERFFSCIGQGINSGNIYMNYYEGPCLFFSALFIPIFWQYVCLLPGRNISKRRKRMAAVLLFVGLFAVLTPMAGVIFNGFTDTFSQYMFLIMAAFAVMSAVTLEEIFGKRRFSIMGAFLASVTLVLGYGWLTLGDLGAFVDMVLIAHMLAGTAMLALLKVGSAGSGLYEDVAPRSTHSVLALGVKYVGVILSLVLMVNVAAEMTVNFRERDSLYRKEARRALLGESKDRRLELLEDPEVLEALAKLREEDPGWYRVEKLYSATGAMDAPFQNYHGISNYSKTMNARIRTFVNQEWIDLLLWDSYHHTYRSDNIDLSLSRLLGIRYLLVKDGQIDRYNGNKLYDSGEIPPEGFSEIGTCGEITIYRDDTMPGMFSFYPASAVSEKTTVSFDERLQDAQIHVLANAREDAFSLEVSADTEGLLFAAIPYEIGWRVFVDGSEMEIVPAETGFLGVWLSEGKHDVRFVYDCPGFRTGLYVSLAAAVVFVVLFVLARRKRGGKPEQEAKAPLSDEQGWAESKAGSRKLLEEERR